jgi:Ran GTPase-activating protein (RanGAP) involved in mRNA processing and transport
METRSRRRQASSLAHVPHDMLLLVGEACSNPLAPKALAYLASTSCQILNVLRPKLNELREFRAELRALCSKERFGAHASSLDEAVRLNWSGRGLGHGLTPADVTVLGRLLRSGALALLKRLTLGTNKLSDAGMIAFAEALNAPIMALRSLQMLSLNANRIGDEGMKAFSIAISSGALGQLTFLHLGQNRVGDSGMQAFASAVANGALGSLRELQLDANQIGNAGMTAFAEALKSPMRALESLLKLSFDRNRIGDEGMQAFSTAINCGALPALRSVVAGSNPGNNLDLEEACKTRGIGFFAW